MSSQSIGRSVQSVSIKRCELFKVLLEAKKEISRVKILFHLKISMQTLRSEKDLYLDFCKGHAIYDKHEKKFYWK